MAYTKAEKEGRGRPKPKSMVVKSRLGITTDFCLSDKGYQHVLGLDFLLFSFAVYRKGWRPIIQWRGKEWRRQREEDYVRLHGKPFCPQT